MSLVCSSFASLVSLRLSGRTRTPTCFSLALGLFSLFRFHPTGPRQNHRGVALKMLCPRCWLSPLTYTLERSRLRRRRTRKRRIGDALFHCREKTTVALLAFHGLFDSEGRNATKDCKVTAELASGAIWNFL